MTYFSFHFLLCNAIICIFLGILLGLKRLLQNQLSARMQYNLSIIFLVVLIVPFFPIKSAPSSISWGHLLMPNSNTNGDIQTTFLSGNSYTLNKIFCCLSQHSNSNFYSLITCIFLEYRYIHNVFSSLPLSKTSKSLT